MRATVGQVRGRMAQCHCGNTRESEKLIGDNTFEFRGEGSQSAMDRCKKCGYHEQAHRFDPFRINPAPVRCGSFEPHGPYEYDLFYDGCGGWD